MHFWIDIKLTKILGQFKQKKIVNLFITYNFKFFKNLLNFIFVNCNYVVNTLLIKIFLYFDYKS
jgi:hypothetical protein